MLDYFFYGTFIFLIVVFILFEKSTNRIEILTLVGILCALSSVGRIIFASVPSVQPSSFIIISSGLMLAPLPSLMIGVLTAFSSSLILGFGMYTPWQALLWGIMGLTSSLLKNVFIDNKKEKPSIHIVLIVIYSFIWGIIFGFVMNLTMFNFMDIDFNLQSYIAFCAISLPMDIMHGLSSALLFAFAGNRFIAILNRICIKYGL